MQNEALTAEKTRLDKMITNGGQQLKSANNVLTALNSNSPLGLSVVKAQMPRVMSEVGNLNQTEQEMWAGSQAWLDRAWQYMDKISTSEVSADNKKALIELLTPFVGQAQKGIDHTINTSARSLSSYGIPPEYAKMHYGGVYQPPAIKSITDKGVADEKLAVEAKAKAKPGKTYVEDANGQRGWIPDAQLAEALKDGYKKVSP